MKAQFFNATAVIILVFSNPSIGDENHHKDEDARQSNTEMMMSAEMPMMDIKMMHRHMAKMQQTMERVHEIKDSKQQQNLMHQHMEEMHEGMAMMQGLMSGPTHDKPMQGKMPKDMHGQMPHDQMPDKMKGRMEMMDDSDEIEDIKAMRQRHNMMEQRMDMMQGMMGQMMKHMMQQQKMNIR